MRWIGLPVAVMLLSLAAGSGCAALASPAPASGWAVIVENDSYGGRYRDLPAAYRNSTRVLTLLVERGWPADHILLVRDDLDPRMLERALGWLAERVRPGDTALLYVAGEYGFFAHDVRWSETVPALWRRIPTSRRVLIVESCFAERLASAVARIPGIALPAVGSNEWDLWGIRSQGPLVEGGAFTYYLTRALAAESRDMPMVFRPAFAEAVAATQRYFRTVVLKTPAALDALHTAGVFPEQLAQYPNPHLIVGAPAAAGPADPEAADPQRAATPWAP